jgi:hypothetical protein
MIPFFLFRVSDEWEDPSHPSKVPPLVLEKWPLIIFLI